MAPPGMTNDSCTLVGILSAFVVVIWVVWLQSPTGRLSHRLIIYVGRNMLECLLGKLSFFVWFLLVGAAGLLVSRCCCTSLLGSWASFFLPCVTVRDDR